MDNPIVKGFIGGLIVGGVGFAGFIVGREIGQIDGRAEGARMMRDAVIEILEDCISRQDK